MALHVCTGSDTVIALIWLSFIANTIMLGIVVWQAHQNRTLARENYALRKDIQNTDRAFAKMEQELAQARRRQ